MNRLPTENPRPPEAINNPPQRPLIELVRLLAVVGAAFVVTTVIAVAIAGRLSPLIPFSWERKVAGNVEFANPWPGATEALRDLTAELEAEADIDDGIEVTVHLVDDPLPNAFATLGGHVVVNRGLVERVSSENALAMVLAHEMAHVQHRDPIALLGRSAVLQLIVALVSGDGGGAALQDILGSAGLLTTLRFNRDMERRADRIALETLASRYGHAGGADEFFERVLDTDEGSAWRDMFRTHPGTEERLDAIAARATATGTHSLEPLPAPLRQIRESSAGGR